MNDFQLFETPPSDFTASIHAAFCYCEYKKTYLLLKRPPGGRNSNVWCIPGGKSEEGESVTQALIREMDEETGIAIGDIQLTPVGIFYCRIPELDYVLYVFRTVFSQKPAVRLALDEHVEAEWFTVEEALKLPLIRGGKELFLHYKNRISA